MENNERIIWITTLGWSPFAVINPLWAYCEQYTDFPDEIYIFLADDEKVKQNINTIELWLKNIRHEYSGGKKRNLRFIELQDDDILTYGRAVDELLQKMNDVDDCCIHVDITPGRKYMSMLLYNAASKYGNNVKAIYYNHLDNNEYFEKPLALTPNCYWRLINMQDYSQVLELYEGGEGDSSKDEIFQKIIEFVKQSKYGVKAAQIEDFMKVSNLEIDQLPIKKVLNKLRNDSSISQDPQGRYVYSSIKLASRGNKIEELYLKLDHFNVLLMEMLKMGLNDFSIEFSPLGNESFSITLDKEIRLNINKDTKVNGNYPRNVKQEVNFSGNFFLDLLKMSGIAVPTNFKEIEKNIQDLYDYNPLAGDRTPFLSFDTNLFRHRFYSFISRKVLAKKKEKRVGFIIADKVEEELSDYDRKLKNNELNELSSIHKNDCISSTRLGKEWHQIVIKNWFNQIAHVDRLIRIGMVDLKKCIEKEFTRRVSYRAATKSPDVKIINTLRDYARDQNINILTMSEDRDFIDRVQAKPGLMPQIVKYPVKHEIPDSIEISWKDLANLIYCCAISKGGVVISGGTLDSNKTPCFVVQGIWAGKSYDDWSQEIVKVWGKRPSMLDPLKKARIIERSQM